MTWVQDKGEWHDPRMTCAQEKGEGHDPRMTCAQEKAWESEGGQEANNAHQLTQTSPDRGA